MFVLTKIKWAIFALSFSFFLLCAETATCFWKIYYFAIVLFIDVVDGFVIDEFSFSRGDLYYLLWDVFEAVWEIWYLFILLTYLSWFCSYVSAFYILYCFCKLDILLYSILFLDEMPTDIHALNNVFGIDVGW